MLCRPLIAHARLDHLCTLLPPSPYYPTATSSSHTLRAFALFSLAINLPSSFRPIRPFLSPASQLLLPPPPPFFLPFHSLSFFPLFFLLAIPTSVLVALARHSAVYSSPFPLPSPVRDTRRYRLTRRFFTLPRLAISVYLSPTLLVSSVVLDRSSRSIAATFSRSVSYLCPW